MRLSLLYPENANAVTLLSKKSRQSSSRKDGRELAPPKLRHLYYS
jgi:hypothetical protein